MKTLSEDSVVIHYIKYYGVTGHRAVAHITYPPVNGDEPFDYFLDLEVEDSAELCVFLKDKIRSGSVEVLPSDDSLVDFQAAKLKAERDSLLSATDYLVQPDYPITESQREEVKSYRQALRDVPQQEGFPLDVVWPEKPAFIK